MLDRIRVMWEALNLYHCQRSAHFKEHYLGMTFKKRKANLLKKAACGRINVNIAIDRTTEKEVGYVVSSLNSELTGEIDSIYVDEAYRGMGIGDRLMKNTLSWMDQNSAEEKIVEVSIGNEQAWKFYGHYGFLPRKTVLKQVGKT